MSNTASKMVDGPLFLKSTVILSLCPRLEVWLSKLGTPSPV